MALELILDHVPAAPLLASAVVSHLTQTVHLHVKQANDGHDVGPDMAFDVDDVRRSSESAVGIAIGPETRIDNHDSAGPQCATDAGSGR